MPRTLHQLPTVVDPPDDICLLVFVPNDQAYINAVMGQIGQLAAWHNWQRDQDKTGRLVAQRFLRSYDETTSFLKEVDGNMCPLTININSTCCNDFPLSYEPTTDLGQITPEQAAEIIVLPTDLVDDGITPPTLSFPDYDSYLAWKCQISNDLADDILETFNRLGSMGLLFASVGATGLATFLTSARVTMAFVGFLAAFLTPVGAVATVISIFTAALLVGIRAMQYFHKLRDQISREELVCGFYTSASPQAARATFMGHVADTYPNITWEGGDQTIFTEMFEALMDQIAPEEIFSLLFETISAYDTSGTYDCSACEDPPITVDTIVGSWDGQEDWTSAMTSNTDAICRSKLDIEFGGWADNGVDEPPYITITAMSHNNYFGNCGTFGCFSIYRGNGDGLLTLNPGDPIPVPIHNVYRITMSSRTDCPVDGSPCLTCEFTAHIEYDVQLGPL